MVVISMKFRDHKKLGKKEIHERIANQIHKRLNQLQLKGLIGQKHPIAKEEIQFIMEEYCIKQKWISPADKIRRDYMLFLERLYTTIMNNYIRKDELNNEDDLNKIQNPYYYPGLIHLTGVGWIITNDIHLVNKYESQRTYCLDSQKKHLNQKCQDANDFIEQLPAHQKELLDEHKEVA